MSSLLVSAPPGEIFLMYILGKKLDLAFGESKGMCNPHLHDNLASSILKRPILEVSWFTHQCFHLTFDRAVKVAAEARVPGKKNDNVTHPVMQYMDICA